MQNDERDGNTVPDTVTTGEVKDLLPTDRKDESTAHLTLPAVPQERGFAPDGRVTDPERLAANQKDREAALAPVQSFKVAAPAKVGETGVPAESRTVELRVNEAAGTQEAVTVVSEPPAVQADAINQQQTAQTGSETASTDTAQTETGAGTESSREIG